MANKAKEVKVVEEVKPVEVEAQPKQAPSEPKQAPPEPKVFTISEEDIMELSNIIEVVVNAEKVGAADFRGGFFAVVNKLNTSFK